VPSPSISSGYAPVTAVRSVTGEFFLPNRNGPPGSPAFTSSDAGLEPPARKRSGMPSPLQSNVATPPPTKNGNSPS
jgi:hypothetical protein